VGGPWFAVHESGTDWNEWDTIWISNGDGHWRARVEVRVQLEKARDEQ